MLEGMQSFDYELERLINTGQLDRETALSYATNRTNLQLRLDTQGGAEIPTVGIKPKEPATAARRASAPKSELDDLIER